METNKGKAIRMVLTSIGVIILVAASLAGCAKKADTRTRYHLEGKVLSVDSHEGTATIDHKAIPGYMDAMTMPYAAENPKELEKIAAGDQITADLVEEQGVPLLTNIVVTQKAPPNGTPASAPKQ
jgi:protein SCO1/2